MPLERALKLSSVGLAVLEREREERERVKSLSKAGEKSIYLEMGVCLGKCTHIHTAVLTCHVTSFSLSLLSLSIDTHIYK